MCPQPDLQPSGFPACRLHHHRTHRPLSPPGQYLALLCMTSLATRQGAKTLNKALSFDLSSINKMDDMFKVRALAPTSSRALPCLRSAPPVPCT